MIDLTSKHLLTSKTKVHLHNRPWPSGSEWLLEIPGTARWLLRSTFASQPSSKKSIPNPSKSMATGTQPPWVPNEKELLKLQPRHKIGIEFPQSLLGFQLVWTTGTCRKYSTTSCTVLLLHVKTPFFGTWMRAAMAHAMAVEAKNQNLPVAICFGAWVCVCVACFGHLVLVKMV